MKRVRIEDFMWKEKRINVEELIKSATSWHDNSRCVHLISFEKGIIIGDVKVTWARRITAPFSAFMKNVLLQFD